MTRAALIVFALATLAACGSTPPSRFPEVVYTSSDGIALRGASGAVHFYRFKSSRND